MKSTPRIRIEPACEPHDGTSFAVYYDREGEPALALGRHSAAWSDGAVEPFPNNIAALAATHCIPLPKEFR